MCGSDLTGSGVDARFADRNARYSSDEDVASVAFPDGSWCTATTNDWRQLRADQASQAVSNRVRAEELATCCRFSSKVMMEAKTSRECGAPTRTVFAIIVLTNTSWTTSILLERRACAETQRSTVGCRKYGGEKCAGKPKEFASGRKV